MISRGEFKKEVENWAEQMGVAPKEIHVKLMKRKWASCSSKGRLTFDPSLFKVDTMVRNEVIVHELLHLKYPHHGKMFKALARSYLKKFNERS